MPQPLMTELSLTGAADTLEMVGTTDAGDSDREIHSCTTLGKPRVVSIVSSVAVAAPDVALGIADSHESGIVYEA